MMPAHDWTPVDAGTVHHFHSGWIVRLSDYLNGGWLPDVQRWISRLLAIAVIGSAIDAVGDPADAATRVDLVIDEPLADRPSAWPITTGVPFPRGKLSRAECCRLIDDRGQEQPLQTQVAATWDAERKSVRWLTIDFLAEPGRKYAL